MKEEKTNKQTNKHKTGEEMKNSSLPFKSECCLQACSAVDVALSFSPLYIFFCYCHFPCWEDSCHPSHILCAEKAALPCAW